jgi:hypothetical protein
VYWGPLTRKKSLEKQGITKGCRVPVLLIPSVLGPQKDRALKRATKTKGTTTLSLVVHWRQNLQMLSWNRSLFCLLPALRVTQTQVVLVYSLAIHQVSFHPVTIIIEAVGSTNLSNYAPSNHSLPTGTQPCSNSAPFFFFCWPTISFRLLTVVFVDYLFSSTNSFVN